MNIVSSKDDVFSEKIILRTCLNVSQRLYQILVSIKNEEQILNFSIR